MTSELAREQSTLLLQVAAMLAPAVPAAAPAAAEAGAEAGTEEGAAVDAWTADGEVEAGSAVLYVSAEESVEQVRS